MSAFTPSENIDPATAQDASGSPVSPVPPKVPKDQSIETLRGIAIFLVVMGHVVLEMSRSGVIAKDGALNYLTESVSYLRMPLFTVISGYVYALRPVKSGAEAKFLAGKMRRLVLPLLSVGLITVVYSDFRQDGVAFNQLGERAFEIFILNSSHVWFLKALLWILLLTVVLDAAGAINKVAPWAIVLGLTAMTSMAMAGDQRHLIAFMAVGNTLYIAPFFFLGLGLRRFHDEMHQSWILWSAIGVTVVGMAYQQWAMTWPAGAISPELVESMWDPWTYANKLAITVVGLSGTLLLFLIRRPLPGMNLLGHHAYSIFLFHGICYYAAYVGCAKVLKIEDPRLLFAAMLWSGLLIPIGLKFVILRMFWSRRLLLGLR